MAQRIYILPVRQHQEEAVFPSSISEPRKPISERAREAFEKRAGRAQDALLRARNQLGANARTATERVRRAARERPFHFIAGIAGAAFVLGVALRIWRSQQHG